MGNEYGITLGRASFLSFILVHTELFEEFLCHIIKWIGGQCFTNVSIFPHFLSFLLEGLLVCHMRCNFFSIFLRLSKETKYIKESLLTHSQEYAYCIQKAELVDSLRNDYSYS